MARNSSVWLPLFVFALVVGAFFTNRELDSTTELIDKAKAEREQRVKQEQGGGADEGQAHPQLTEAAKLQRQREELVEETPAPQQLERQRRTPVDEDVQPHAAQRESESLVHMPQLTPITCPNFKPIDAPLSGLEQEIVRIWNISSSVMEEVGATYWPTDGTLLGLMRNGRVATDRDIDLQVHSTREKCQSFLSSLKALFAKRCSLQSFKVVGHKDPKSGKKIGRYAMVRMHRRFGTFSTGVDFNCVYTDEPGRPHFFTHRGIYTLVPPQVFPLGKCAFYNYEVPCPKDGYAVLEALKPRYDGCMVFPHCMGNPDVAVKKCLTPHPVVPLSSFVENTKQLGSCGYTSLAEHYAKEKTGTCKALLDEGESLATKNCKQEDKGKICFLQGFKG